MGTSYPDPSPMPGGPITVSYSYDSVGNCVSEGSERKYEWDHAGRLRSFRNQAADTSEPTQYVQYLYDAAGQRVKKLNRKRTGANWDAVVYIDGVLELRTQKRGATTKQGLELHVLDGQKRLGRRRSGDSLDSKPDNLLVLGDHLGSANVELDWSLGSFVDREEFRPYGETSFGSYVNKRYRFTGKERDEESGLNYHGARYYAPGLARWMSPDPKGLVDGVNLYEYAKSSPICHTDPTGTESELETTKAELKHDGITGTTTNHSGSSSKNLDSSSSNETHKNFADSSIYLSTEILNSLIEFFPKSDQEHINGKPIEKSKLSPNIRKASEGNEMNILQVDINHKSTEERERFQMLIDVVKSKEKIVGIKPKVRANEMYEMMNARAYFRDPKKPSGFPGRYVLPGNAQTLCSLNLQRSVYGASMLPTIDTRSFSTNEITRRSEVIDFYTKPTFTSIYQDVSVLLFRLPYPSTVAHELLGHIWLAIQKMPFEHTGKLPDLCIDGKCYKRGEGFIWAVAHQSQ